MKGCLAAVGAGTRAGAAASASIAASIAASASVAASIAASVAAAAENQQDGNDNPTAVSTEETIVIAHTETSCEVVDRQTSVSFHSMRGWKIGVQESRAVFTSAEAATDSASVNTPCFINRSRSVSLLPE